MRALLNSSPEWPRTQTGDIGDLEEGGPSLEPPMGEVARISL